MLRGLSPLHTPDLLYILASAGHGDELALVDSNFPAASHAKRLVRLDGASLPDALQACLQLFPLDTFVENPALRMMQAHAADEIPPVQQECQRVIDQAETRPIQLAGISREAFYERARQAYAIVITGERRVYGCIVIRKGVVFPSDGD